MRKLTHEDEICTALAKVGNDALRVIDKDYGNPQFGRVPSTCVWPYHNGFHGRYVGNAALWICEALGGDRIEQAVAMHAGHAHDIKQGDGHEQQGADWLERELQRQGIPPHLRRMGALAIQGTKPIFDDDRNVLGQEATRLDYPSKAEERVAHSVATADLAMIHDPMGPYWSRQFYAELKGKGLDEMETWQQQHLALAAGRYYRYPVTDRGILRRLERHRSAVIDHHKRVLKKIQKGDFSTFEQMIADDLTFARAHS